MMMKMMVMIMTMMVMMKIMMMMIIIMMVLMKGNDDDDDPHPSLQLIDLYISSIVTNSSRCLCHVLSSVSLAIEQLILITTVTR